MTDIKLFLTTLGLAQYGEVFVDNDIDLVVAPELTDEDLQKLGLSLGHRRKFIAAARKRDATGDPPVVERPTAQLERRQVTVVFADLVGSTALANTLDPEDLNAVLTGYREVCVKVISAFQGHVAQYLGDGVMAYFGFPQAQEQAAERAVRAALALVEQVARAEHAGSVALTVRVGIATGLVVGELDATATDREQTVVGSTPNLAARLQASAEPGCVMVADATRQLAGEFFDFVAAGETTIKGFEQPVLVWRVVGERTFQSRFAAARGDSMGPIVARARELAFLEDAWTRAVHGNGHLVLIAGEAGIGKSRLVEAFVERIETEPHRLLRCQCSPYHQNTALFPVAQLLRLPVSSKGDGSTVTLQSIEAMLASCGRSSRRNLLLVAELLEIATIDRLSDMELTAAQRNAETLVLLGDLLLHPLDDAPVLLVLEDVHWSDPTTQSLFERLLDRVETERALVLVTHRPEFEKRWGDSAHATTLTCKQLGPESCNAIVRHAAGGAIDEALLREIVERSDGVPLYVEELTKAVVAMRTSGVAHVPTTLQDSLMTRLDRLGRSKDIALVASVIGRSFALRLLASISGVDETALRLALRGLLDAGIFVANDDTKAIYSFNHSLVQEAAYESMSLSRRQTLHLDIARTLASDQSGTANAPEIIAQHFSRALQAESSCRFWVLAAEKASRRSSFAEAIASLHAGLLEAERIAVAPARDRCLLDLQLRLGATFIIQAGPLSSDAEAALTKAYALAGDVGAERERFQATWGLYIGSANSRRFDEAKAFGDELLAIGQRLGDDDLQVEGLHHRWGYWYFAGSNARMIEFAQEGRRRYDAARHHHLAHVFAGHDLGVCAHCVEAIGLGLSGQGERVDASVRAAVALAESLRHPTSLGFALGAGSVAMHLAGDIDACGTLAERGLEVVDKYDLALPRALAHFMLGLARTEQGDVERGLALMEANHAVAVRYSFLGVYPDVAMAGALARGGRSRDSLALIARTLDTIASPRMGLHVSELWRMRGELSFGDRSDSEDAERYLRMAIAISGAQGATIYRARAEAALSRVREQRRSDPTASPWPIAPRIG